MKPGLVPEAVLECACWGHHAGILGQFLLCQLGLAQGAAIVSGVGLLGRAEAEGGGRRVEEALFDAVEGSFGEDVDAVDYVV